MFFWAGTGPLWPGTGPGHLRLRHPEARAILDADEMTDFMRRVIDEADLPRRKADKQRYR